MSTIDTSGVHPTILAVGMGLRLNMTVFGRYAAPWWKLDDVGFLCIEDYRGRFHATAFINHDITNVCDLSNFELQEIPGGVPKRLVTTLNTASPWAVEKVIRNRLLPH